MKKIILYSAASLNGKIARSNGNVDWLESIPNPENSDYGYFDFYKTIDTTIQGFNTYQQIIDWGIEFPYKEKKNYVLTRKQGLNDTEHVQFVSANHIKFIRELKQQAGKDIWLIGGGQVNTLLFNENLIDEVHLHIMPVIIPDGIEIFENKPQQKMLKLNKSKSYASGVVELQYKIE